MLVAGAMLAPGKRTVTQALRVMGLAANPSFSRHHEVLNRVLSAVAPFWPSRVMGWVSLRRLA